MEVSQNTILFCENCSHYVKNPKYRWLEYYICDIYDMESPADHDFVKKRRTTCNRSGWGNFRGNKGGDCKDYEERKGWRWPWT
jgi:hypothetical protein